MGALMVDGRGSKLTDNQAKTLEELQAKKAVGSITEKQEAERVRLEGIQNRDFEFGGTAMDLIRDTWLQWQYGFSEPVKSEEMAKGLACEQDGFDLLQKVHPVGVFRVKNTRRFENQYLTGEPDVVLDIETGRIIEDTKLSFSIKTFMNAKPTTMYHAQGQGYMELADAELFHLRYCLVPTPDDQITEMKKRWWYYFGMEDDNQDYVNIAKQIEHNHRVVPTLVPLEERVKTFTFQRDREYMREMEKRIRLAWKVMDTMKL